MYEVIADYYDLFMDHADRKEWIKFALDAANGRGGGADVGCGSGAVAIELARAGHDMVAIDSSVDMLRRASENFMRTGLKIPTVLMKAENLRLTRKVDFITAMCDVVNYLKAPEKFFSAAYDNLCDNGVLIFDISSESKLRDVLADNVFTRTERDVTYIWENFLGNGHVDMELTFFVPIGNGLYEKKTDTQRQFIHKTDDVIAALTQCGYKTEYLDGGDRIYFVAKKGD